GGTLQELSVVDREPSAEDLEVPHPALRPEDAPWRTLLLRARQERIALPAQRSRRQVDVAHEALDRLPLGTGAVAQLLGEARLQLEGESVLLAAGGQVGGVADAEQEVARGAGLGDVVARKHAPLEDLSQRPGMEAHLRDPERRFQISEAALPVLQIWLEEEDRVAELLAARAQLPGLGLDEAVRVTGALLDQQRAIGPRPQAAVAGDPPGVEEGGPEIRVLARGGAGLGEGADAPAEVDARIPERGGEGTGEAGHLSAPGVEEEQIPVRARAHLAAAGPTDADEDGALELVERREHVPERSQRHVRRRGHQPCGGQAWAAAGVKGADALERLCPMLPEAVSEVAPRRKGRHGRGERLRADAIGRGGQRVWIDGHRGPRPGSLGDAVSRCRTAPPVAD